MGRSRIDRFYVDGLLAGRVKGCRYLPVLGRETGHRMVESVLGGNYSICAALDTPLAYIRKKIDPRPPGPQALGAVFWPPGRILAQKSVFAIGPRISSMGRF